MNADINDLEHGKFVTSIDDPTKRGIVALNPDGSTISGGGSGVAAYSDSGDVAKKGLVDADRHVQTDVLSSALPTNAATSIKQSDGSQKTQIVDSSGNVIASTSNAMHVHIASGSSSGTQYTESDTDASITGTAIMWEDTADTLMPVSETKPLPVNIVAGSSSGTEYTEDDVAVGNPSGGMLMAVRTDALSAVTSTDGDNIALRATNKGELYVKQTDVVQVDVGSMPTTNVAQSGSWTVIADAGTDLNTSSLVTSSEFNEKIGAITETAPISDTASSGLNGRLQRIAQRITSLIALIPSALTGSGNFKVAVQEALPSGTNNIGDIDVLTVPSDPFGANADAASATGSISAKLRFIASTGIPVTGTVTVGSHAVTNAGTFAVQSTNSDVAATGNITTQNLVPAGTATANSAILSGTLNGQGSASVQVTGTYTGALSLQGTVDNSTWVTIGGLVFVNVNTGAQSATITSGATGIYQVDCGGYQQVRVTGLAAMTGTATVTIRASINSGLVALDTPLPTGTNVIGALSTNQSVNVSQINGVTPLMGAGNTGTGSPRVTIATDQATIPVSLASVPSHAVTNAGTFAVQAASAGDVAHDGVDSGNPIKMGGKATNVEPTAVSATGDRANFITDMVGKQIILPYANPENFVSGAITTAMTGTTSTSLIAAPAAGLRNYITQITVSNAHATVGTDVVIQDGSGGTTLYTIPAAAVYGGAVLTFPTPLRQPTTATAIFCANVTTGASTKVSASGYKGI